MVCNTTLFPYAGLWNVPQFERMDTVTEEILDYDFREWRDAAYTVFPTTT